MFHAGLLRDPAPAAPDWPQRFARLAHSARDPRLRAYYAAGMVPGNTPLRAVPLLALDLETTGLDPVRDAIVSIGTVPLGLDTIRASAARHWILRPRIPLDDQSVTLHGITHSRVRHAPDLADVLEEVLAEMAGKVLVVHCRDLERRFFNGALLPRLGESIEFPVIDTMALEARLHRQPTSWLQQLLGRRTPPVSIRLAASRSRYGLPRYRLHHAVTDALASAELLQAQIAHHYSAATPLRDLWL